MRESRRYWSSLAALAVALPLSLVVHSRGEIVNLARAAMSAPIVVEQGSTQAYAGGQWRLANVARMPGELPDTVAVVAEFTATVEDAGRLQAGGPCAIALVDAAGRRWKPVFIAERSVRDAYPDLADRPRCGAFDTVAAGDTVVMVESFLVPADAEGLTLSVTLAGASPDSLLLR